MDKEQESQFKKLRKINVSEHAKKKNGLDYLAWSYAWGVMKELDPKSTRVYTMFDIEGSTNKVPWNLSVCGAYVECTVTINNHSETDQLPVTDFRNKAILIPNVMDINTAKQRVFVKCIALFGYGLHIYEGLDAPKEHEEVETEFLNNAQILWVENGVGHHQINRDDFLGRYQADDYSGILKRCLQDIANEFSTLKVSQGDKIANAIGEE